MPYQTMAKPGDSVPQDVRGRDDSDTLQRLEKQLAIVTALLKRAKQEEDRSDSMISAKRAAQLKESLKELTAFDGPLGEIERRQNERAERAFLELRADLEAACAGRGWRLEGVWPTLYIERGIAVEIDENKRSISIAGRKLPSSTVAAVLTTLDSLVPGLMPKGFDSAGFLRMLATAYDEVKRSSAQVAIFDVYRQLVLRNQGPRFWRDARKEMFTELSIDQFRARLSRCLEETAPTTTDGRALRLLPPLNPKDGLFMYQPAESRFGFIGRIELVDSMGAQE